MDHAVFLIPAFAPPQPYQPDPRRPADRDIVQKPAVPTPGPLPAEQPFMAQAVTAQLHGSAHFDRPGEILPAERVLRPYSTPMLPADKPADT